MPDESDVLMAIEHAEETTLVGLVEVLSEFETFKPRTQKITKLRSIKTMLEKFEIEGCIARKYKAGANHYKLTNLGKARIEANLS